jgi:hypothetical protein
VAKRTNGKGRGIEKGTCGKRKKVVKKQANVKTYTHGLCMYVQCEEKKANRKRKNAKKRVNGINKYVKKWTNEEGEEDSKP